MMTAAELRDFIREHFTRTAFRLETLQQYDPTAPDYRRYLNGEPGPNKQAWIDRLRDERERGLYRHRVRIVTAPVTDYTRYECEWGYAPNAEAGEDIRILDLSERAMPRVVGWLVASDWWLLGDEYLISMRYSEDGQFVGARDESGVHLWDATHARDLLWDAAEPFADWWGRHRELHRDGRQAA